LDDGLSPEKREYELHFRSPLINDLRCQFTAHISLGGVSTVTIRGGLGRGVPPEMGGLRRAECELSRPWRQARNRLIAGLAP
jgi:hypothetical protein